MNADIEPRWGLYERLRPDQIEAIRGAAPIAYLPWGALEWHSYHNPIGLDGMQAFGQCTALAHRTGGLVLPTLYVGTDTIKPFKGFGHTIEHAESTVAALCHEFLTQLAEERFVVVVIVTGHCGGRHVEVLREAIVAFAVAHPEVSALLVPSFEPIQDEYPSNHAARGETSFQLLFEPERVAMDRIPAHRTPTLDEDGVWGEDPRSASAEEGRAMLALFVERTVPLIQSLLHRHTT